MSRGFLIGLDSGGAKTAAALCDDQGRVLARARGPGAAIVGMPDDHFFDTVRACCSRLCAQAGIGFEQVARVGIGLSGVDYPDEQARQHAAIADRLGLAGRLDLVNDGLVALWGVSASPNVALMQHGSGVTTAYRSGFGGAAIYDSLDVAEMYDIRRAAFALTARMIDGRAAPTPLRERMLAYCGVPAASFAEWAFRDPAAGTKRLAVPPVVYQAWADGDAAATQIVRLAADDYVRAMRAMGARIGAPFEAAFGGGVIAQGGQAFQALISVRLAAEVPQAQLTPIALPPELGAVVMAGHGCRLDPMTMFANLAAAESVL